MNATVVPPKPTPPPLEIHPRKRKAGAYVTIGLEIIGLVVLCFYTNYAREMAQEAQKANQFASDADRPWVGLSIAIQNWEVGKNGEAVVYFTNSGRRPAKLIATRFDTGNYQTLPLDPPYRQNQTDVKGQGLILPNTSLTNSAPLGTVTSGRLAELGKRQVTFFLFASVEYEDVLTRKQHWTHGCWQYLPGFQNVASGFVNCSTYNDIDTDS